MARKSSRQLWANFINNEADATAKRKGNKETARTDSRFNRVPYEGVIIGIDPSLRATGLAVLEFQAGKPPKLLASETISIPPTQSMATCLGRIFIRVSEAMKKYKVRHAAVEQTIYVQNFQTAQILGSARGAAMAAVSVLDMEVFEYPPLRVKQAVVGYGRASKEQVAGMVQSILGLTAALPDDESDAIATALCHAYTYRPQE